MASVWLLAPLQFSIISSDRETDRRYFHF